METYIEYIQNNNNGPLNSLQIKFGFKQNGNPKPTILVGKNGCGKSIALSNIVDSLYESAKTAYSNACQPNEHYNGFQYFKAISPDQITAGKEFLCSYVKYSTGEEYIFKSGNLSFMSYQEINPICSNKLDWGSYNKTNNFKKCTFSKNQAEKIFENEAIAYFPPSRYEKPIWLGNKYFEPLTINEISIKSRSNGDLDNKITPENCSQKNISWILSVLMDSRCDIKLEADTKQLSIDHNPNVNNTLFFGQARKNIETLLSEILNEKVYLDLGYRNEGSQRLKIRKEADDSIFAPSIESLSTGQLALFDLFATIIRYGDNYDLKKGTFLSDISGIAIIDEVDLHLHSSLQFETLPKLIRLFPKVQFILTTHSPLFLLGMSKQFTEDDYEIFELPTGIQISSEDFSEFEIAYNAYRDTEQYHAELEKISFENLGKALIITEGTTDWRHLEAAYNYLSQQEELKDKLPSIQDFEFYKYGPENDKICSFTLEMGDRELQKLCEYSAKTPHSYPLICIFDSDNDAISKKMGNEHYKDWGNNVFSFVIPTPEFRKQGISIELLYQDEELKQPIDCEDGVTRRLYLNREFNCNGISTDCVCADRNKIKNNKIVIVDNDVYSNDPENQQSLALSKVCFANAILNNKITVSFSEFIPIFETINNIINEVKNRK